MAKICAVVVTHNRLSLLKECIIALLDQTTSLDKIIIINNKSTDGTQDWLETLESDDKFTVINQENVGGAGGFYTGVKQAFESTDHYDWIWMMDDDVEPFENCLEVLLRYQNVSKCLHPVKKYIDDHVLEWQHYFLPNTGEKVAYGNWLFKHDNEICFLNAGNFEGMLIHRDIVNYIGYPNPDYFYVEDDTEYGYKASFYTNVAYVRDALLTRKKMQQEETESTTYLYYKYRNQFILMNVFRKHPIYGFRKKSPFFRTIWKMAKSDIKHLNKSADIDKRKKIKAILKGIWAGLNKQTGRANL